jgi:predicted transcriptional regulator YheO
MEEGITTRYAEVADAVRKLEGPWNEILLHSVGTPSGMVPAPVTP